MRIIRIATLAVVGLAMGATPAASAPLLIAVVENLTGSPAGVEFMDYLETGKIIRLGARDTIVLGYMSSCVRETITGGTVTVGIDQSDVQSGTVERIKVPCDGGKTLLARAQASQIAGKIFRGPAPVTVTPAPADAQLTIYGSSPMLELNAPGILMIERIDQSGERQAVYVGNEQLLHGAFYDFARWGKTLTPGGTYRVTLQAQEIVFKIDPDAKAGASPIVSRLVRFQPN